MKRMLIVPNIHHKVGLNSAGFRFRAKYFSERTNGKNFDIVICDTAEKYEKLIFDKSFDIVLFQKRMVDKDIIGKIRDSRNPIIIFDLCDNYFADNDSTSVKCKEMVENVDCVFTTNDFLAEKCIENGAKKAITTPEILDIHDVRKKVYENSTDKKVLLWHGNVGGHGMGSCKTHKGGMFDLLLIEDTLKKLSDFIKIVIVTGFDLSNIPNEYYYIYDRLASVCEVNVYKWDNGIIDRLSATTDITVFPVINSNFTNGKSANRVLMSWFCGIPSLASPSYPYIDVNSKANINNYFRFVTNDNEWFEAIKDYIFDLTYIRNASDYFGKIVSSYYNVDDITSQWVEAIEGLCLERNNNGSI